MDRPHPLLDIHAEVLNIVRYLREVLPKDIIISTPTSSSTQSQPLAQSLENIADKIYRQYLQESAAVHDDHDNATLPTYTHGKRTSVSFKRKTRGTRTESMALLASTVSKILEEEHVHDDYNNDDDPLEPNTPSTLSTTTLPSTTVEHHPPSLPRGCWAEGALVSLLRPPTCPSRLRAEKK
jgi:hypothetical protein